MPDTRQMIDQRSSDGVEGEWTAFLEVPTDQTSDRRTINVESGFKSVSAPEAEPTALPEDIHAGVLVPDGGWGWIVCLGSFVVNFLLDGTMFSFGVLMLELLADLGQDKSTTAWIGSAQMGIHMCMGPVISIMLRRFSIRQVVVAGSLLASVGFLTSSFAPNIYVLIFTYGIIGGIGIGMMFLPAIIVVNLYFSNKRAIATGVATSGSGLGTFAYAYLMDILLEHYNWRGSVLILGGLLLNCMVCGLLFRPLMPRQQALQVITTTKQNTETIITVHDDNMKADIYSTNSAWTESLSDSKTFKKACQGSSQPCQGFLIRSEGNIYQLLKEPEKRCHSLKDFQQKSFSNQNLKELHCLKSSYKSRSQGCSLDHQKYVGKCCDQQGPGKNIKKKGVNLISGCQRHCSEFQHDVVTRQKTCDAAIHEGITNFIREDVREIIHEEIRETTCKDIKDMMQKKRQCHHMERDQRWTFKQFRQTFREWIPVELLRNKTFVLLLVTFTTWTAQSVTLTYLPDLAVSMGIDRTPAAFLISMVGIFNILGRLFAGFIADCFHIPSIWLYCVALAVAAVSNLAAPFCVSYLFLQVFSAVFGLCMAVAVSMRTIVLTEQLGVQALTESFGVVALFQGVTFTINPPIAGKLIDDFGSFKPPFLMSGIMYMISALSAFVVGYLNHCSQSSPVKDNNWKKHGRP